MPCFIGRRGHVWFEILAQENFFSVRPARSLSCQQGLAGVYNSITSAVVRPCIRWRRACIQRSEQAGVLIGATQSGASNGRSRPACLLGLPKVARQPSCLCSVCFHRSLVTVVVSVSTPARGSLVDRLLHHVIRPFEAVWFELWLGIGSRH